MQEFGVASDLADGRKNPTGLIYLSKAKMNWSENGSRAADADISGAISDGLPDLSAFMLTDSEK